MPINIGGLRPPFPPRNSVTAVTEPRSIPSPVPITVAMTHTSRTAPDGKFCALRRAFNKNPSQEQPCHIADALTGAAKHSRNVDQHRTLSDFGVPPGDASLATPSRKGSHHESPDRDQYKENQGFTRWIGEVSPIPRRCARCLPLWRRSILVSSILRVDVLRPHCNPRKPPT